LISGSIHLFIVDDNNKKMNQLTFSVR